MISRWFDEVKNLTSIGVFIFLFAAVSFCLPQEAENDECLRTFEGHNFWVESVVFSPDGRYIVSGSRDKTIKLWDVETGECLRTFEGHKDGVLSVAFSPDGKCIVSGSGDKTIKLWSVGTGECLRTFEGHKFVVYSIVISPDGKCIASGSWDNTIKLWSVGTGECLRTFEGHKSWVLSVIFSPDGKCIASGSWDKTIKLWSVGTGECLRTFEGHKNWVYSVAFSPDGRYIGSGSLDKTIKLWDVETGRCLRTFEGHRKTVYSVVFSPDGKYIVSGSGDKTIKLWSVGTGECLRTFEGHKDGVLSVAFSPDREYIVSGSRDNTIKLWAFPYYEMKVKELLTYRERTIRKLEEEKQEKIDSLYRKGEFETMQQYQERLRNADRKKKEIEELYKRKIEQELAKIDKEIDRIIKESRSPFEVKNTAELQPYDADREMFKIIFRGKRYDLKVPLALAKDFKTRFNSMVIKGERQLNRKGKWEYFNCYVYDPDAGNKYPFGEQRGQALATAVTPGKPPRLIANVSFTEPSGEGFLDAEEKGIVKVEIRNEGEGEAYDIIAELLEKEDYPDIYTELSKTIPELSPGESKIVEFAIEAAEDVGSGLHRFEIKFTEANGFEPAPIEVAVETRAMVPPDIIVADMAVDDYSGNGKIEPSEIATITVRLFNQGKGVAKSVVARVELGENVFFTGDSRQEFDLGNIPPSGVKDIQFSIYTNNRIKDKIPVAVNIIEAREKFNRSYPLDLRVNVPQKRSQELVVFKGRKEDVSYEGRPAGISVDIEKNIPETEIENREAIAVVIGNRDYLKAKNVEFAIRDAEFVKDYLIKTLGYREGNIFMLKNALYSDFVTYFGSRENYKGKLYNVVKPGRSDVFIYYSGHGAPGLKDKRGYFVPVDCDPHHVELSGYPLDLFYENLSKIPARSFTVVLDACFSGANVFGDISPVVIEIESPAMKLRNAVIFCSASSDEVSSWYNDKYHSLFTYFFLKGIHNWNADLNKDRAITYEELYKFISDDSEGVPYWARRLHGVEQHPVIQGDYKNKIFISY